MAAHPTSRPWLVLAVFLLLVLAGQSAFLYPRLRVKEAEIVKLREAIRARDLREAQHGDATQTANQAEEITRLRRDNQELHRLRNEVRQLRETVQQTAQQPVQPPAPPSAPAPSALMLQLQRQVQQLQTENAQLRAAQQQVADNQAQDRMTANTCINNLRQLDGAKQQWALENRQPSEAVPEPADLEPYLRDPAVWACPAGGAYTLNAVDAPPVCSIPGHTVP